MSGKSVLLSRLGCGLVLLFGACFALDAWAALSFSPPTVTGTIHYSPTPPALTITAPVAVTIVGTQSLEFTGSLGTAGNLSINGVNVPLTPSHTFDYVAPLNEGPNTISFLGVDLGGNQTTLTRSIDVDTTPPDAPNTALITVSPSYDGDISVSGAAGSVDPDTLITIVDLNTGVQVTVMSDGSGAFSTSIAAQTGDPISIIATSEAGITSSNGDQVPAMITITSVTLTTDQFGYVLAGQLDESATLTVNGTPVQVNPDLTFTDPVPLNSASNTFTLVATDLANNETFQTVVMVVLDDEPPTITITSPGAYTNQNRITITGSVSFLSGNGTLRDPNGNNLTLTPIDTLPPSDAFSYTPRQSLVGGPNSFTFYATDLYASDESAQLTWSTIFDPGPLVIDATLVSATDILDGSGNPTGQTMVTGAAGAVTKDPNYGAPISVTLTGVASGQSASPVAPNSTGAFGTILSASAEAPLNIVATDLAGNSADMRVQFGTSCYADSSTLDTQLTVADGSGTVSGPNGGTALFHITRSGELSFDTYVDYRTGQTGDTAVSGTDYTGGMGSFKIPAGATDADLSISLLNSNGNGPDKTFTLHILGVHNVIGTSGNLALGSCVTPATVIGTEHYNIIPTTITVTAPTAATFESPYQVLTGSVTAGVGETVTLTLNGTHAALNPDNTFNLPITLQPGSNTYTLIATDGSGNTVSTVETYTLNTSSLSAPVGISVQFLPSDGQGIITITGQPGTAYSGDQVTVTDITDEQSASNTVDTNGNFTVQLQGSLSDEFSIVIGTPDGQQSPPIFTHGNDPALTLAISSPTAGESVSGSTVNVTGTYMGPLDTGITVNGQRAILFNGQYYANNVSLPASSNTLTVVATTLGGLSTTQTISVSSTGASQLVLSATPADAGVGILNATFQYSYTGAAALQTLEVDYQGTGFNTPVQAAQIPGYVLAYDYSTPGVYVVSLRLTDINGVQYTAQINVVVQDPAQMDALFTSVWSDMTAGLSGGSMPAAMNVLTYEAQQKYNLVFDELLSQMPTIVSSFSPLLESSLDASTAEYAIVRVINGQKHLFFINFVPGTDGVWRLDEM